MSAHRLFNPGPDDLIMADGHAWPAYETRESELDAPRVPTLLRLGLLTDLGDADEPDEVAEPDEPDTDPAPAPASASAPEPAADPEPASPAADPADSSEGVS